MKKVLILGSVLALVAGIFAVPVSAAPETDFEGYDIVLEEDDSDGPTFKMKGQIRGRWDYWNNRTDAKDSSNLPSGAPTGSDQVDFVDYRVRLGLHALFSEAVAGYIELQNFGTMGDSNPVRGVNDPLNPNANSQSNSGVDLYQAYLDLKYGGFKIRLGRAEHILGRQLQIGNDDFYNGISFDGLRMKYGSDKWFVQLYGYNLAERDLTFLSTPAGQASADDGNLYGVDFKWYLSKDEERPAEKFHMAMIYLINLNDRLDGTTPLTSLSAWNDTNIWTVGVHWQKKSYTGWEASVELAGQFGEIMTNGTAFTAPGPLSLANKADAGGTIFEGFFGWNFGDDDRAHRVSIGALVASGRKADDSDFNAWIPLFPNIHHDNRLGDLDLFNGQATNINSTTAVFPIGTPGGNLDGCAAGTPTDPYACQQLGMTNVTDINIRYDYRSMKHDFLAAIHLLGFTEDVLFTTGPGPVVSENAIGTELDLRYTYKQTRNFNWEFGLANLFSGNSLDISPAVVSPTGTPGSADTITRFWVQGHLRWM